MPVRKRNEFLDNDDSEDDQHQSDASDDPAKSRVELASRAAKRRKQDAASDSGDALSDEEADGEEHNDEHATDGRFAQDGVGSAEEDGFPTTEALPKATLKSLARAEKAARKSGVIYISRVPPFMKPHTLKHFLAPHAPKGLGRIFLTPEDHASYLSRKKSGGNKKKSFTDGWVEFVSKTEARMAAERLNGNIIGGKKGNYYHDDLWNMKYLSGFKWSHLTDQISAENAEREARMREEIRRTRKENKAFLEDYERGKMLDTMDKRRSAKGIAADGDQRTSTKSKARKFEQKQVKHASERQDKGDDAALQRTLSMIF